MKPKELIEHYGSEVKAASDAGVSVTTIYNWLRIGRIPRLAQLAFETLTKGKLKAD